MATVDRKPRGSTSERLAQLIYCGLFGFHRGPVVIDGEQARIRCKWCSRRAPAPTGIGSAWAATGGDQDGQPSDLE